MKSAAFFYPYESMISLLPKILQRKGYSIVNIDQETGSIKACKSKTLFRKKKCVDIVLSKMDNHAIQLILSVDNNTTATHFKAFDTSSREEEALLDTLHKYF